VEIRRVLCPVDFSEFSRRALDYAITVSKWYRARLSLLYVHHVPVSSVALFAGLATGPAEGPVLSPADREQLQQQLRGLTRAEDVKDIAVEFTVAEGDIAAEILAEAASVDLVAMGTHGRSGFDRLVLGSVTEKVLRKATCSVSVSPHPRGNRLL
jgi:nucleotide-binding universal stress UspA family protein